MQTTKTKERTLKRLRYDVTSEKNNNRIVAKEKKKQ